MTTAPAEHEQHATAPAASAQPHAPTTLGHPTPSTALTLTRTQKILIGFVAAGAIAIAGIGFAGSYASVTKLAEQKGFGDFSKVFTLGIDIGIGVFLALDLLLTWLRMPYPLLRQGAWLLTAATIAFNAAAAWPDALGVGMHAVIPMLFVIAVEAARHATGRIADITADKHIESPPISRWFHAPFSTYRIYRRMRLWNLRSYDEVIDLQRETLIYRSELRGRYGRKWRSKARSHELLALRLASRYGAPVAATLEKHATGRATDSVYAVAEVPRSATSPAATPQIPRSATRGGRHATPALPAAATTATVTVADPATDESATPVADGSATTRSATPRDATGKRGVASSATTATASSATRSATPAVVPATVPTATTVEAPADADTAYEPGTAKAIVHTLWVNTGKQPLGSEIVAALGHAGLPNSEQQARKIRSQVRNENPNLPGVRAA